MEYAGQVISSIRFKDLQHLEHDKNKKCIGFTYVLEDVDSSLKEELARFYFKKQTGKALETYQFVSPEEANGKAYWLISTVLGDVSRASNIGLQAVNLVYSIPVDTMPLEKICAYGLRLVSSYILMPDVDQRQKLNYYIQSLFSATKTADEIMNESFGIGEG